MSYKCMCAFTFMLVSVEDIRDTGLLKLASTNANVVKQVSTMAVT